MCVKVIAIAKCPDLTPFNGYCSPSCQGAVGDSVTINCSDGFNLTGNSTVNCIETETGGKWDIPTPQCLG